jgi:anti-sigma B factor antagonist
MSDFAHHTPRAGVLALSGDVTLASAGTIKRVLLEALAQGPRLEVDLLNVTKLDTAGVQLLLLMHREATALGVALGWLGYSLAVEEVLDLLDLAAVLGRPSAVVWS